MVSIKFDSHTCELPKLSVDARCFLCAEQLLRLRRRLRRRRYGIGCGHSYFIGPRSVASSDCMFHTVAGDRRTKTTKSALGQPALPHFPKEDDDIAGTSRQMRNVHVKIGICETRGGDHTSRGNDIALGVENASGESESFVSYVSRIRVANIYRAVRLPINYPVALYHEVIYLIIYANQTIICLTGIYRKSKIAFHGRREFLFGRIPARRQVQLAIIL